MNFFLVLRETTIQVLIRSVQFPVRLVFPEGFGDVEPSWKKSECVRSFLELQSFHTEDFLLNPRNGSINYVLMSMSSF